MAQPSMKSPLPVSRRGLYDIVDDVDVPLICPTRQAQKRLFGAPTFKMETVGVGVQPANDPSDRKEAVNVFRRYRARDPVRLVLCGKPS